MKFCVLLFLFIGHTKQECDSIYQIFLASYKDSNGDGIGDLRGLISKLDHFSDIKVDCIYLTPCFKSGKLDAGYDVIDYMEIDDEYGNMKDFEDLLQELGRRGIKLIVDLVINHSSDQHKWFEWSVNSVHPYTDYYVWSDPKEYDHNGKPIVPNNWLNVLSSSAWTWNDKRKQFYLHQFVYNQPDLNLRNHRVLNEIKKIMKFWIDKGVSGFRFDAVMHCAEDFLLRDEPVKNPDKKDIGYSDLDHIHTTNQRETYDIIRELRDDIKSYTDQKKLNQMLIAVEAISANREQLMEYYNVSSFPYNFKLIYMDGWLNAKQFSDHINDWINNLPQGATSNWMTENPDNWRVANKYCDQHSDILTMLMMTLPGVAIIYYGQEIGMKNFNSPNIHYDNGQRLPMQWDTSKNAGFSTKNELFRPVNVDYWSVNVESQKKNEFSHFSMFKRLLHIRQLSSFKYSSFKTYEISKYIFAAARENSDITYVIIVNFGIVEEIVSLSEKMHIYSKPRIEVGTMNSGYRQGQKLDYSATLKMKPISGVVISMLK